MKVAALATAEVSRKELREEIVNRCVPEQGEVSRKELRASIMQDWGRVVWRSIQEGIESHSWLGLGVNPGEVSRKELRAKYAATARRIALSVKYPGRN